MKQKYLSKSVTAACFGILAALASTTAHATLVGPGYPAPGGNTFANNGVALRDASSSQPRIVTYSGFDSSAYGNLYFGAGNDDAFCISLNGNSCSGSEYLRPDANGTIVNNYYSLSGSSSFLNGFNGQTQQADTHLFIGLFDSKGQAIPWASGTSLGLSSSNIIADVTDAAASGGFFYKAYMTVCVQGNCAAPAQQYSAYHMDGGGSLFTSTSTAFFSTPAEANVPEPGSLALFALGAAGLACLKRRKKS